MKNSRMLLSLVMALILALSIIPAATCEEPAVIDQAYLMYADSSWTYQYWSGEANGGMKAINADITGEGDYTVGLDFTETPDGAASGVAFAALGIVNGENTMPGWYIRINEIRVNGEAIAFDKGYTSSDDGITTRMNIYNEWVSDLPADARSFDGKIDDTNWMIVDSAAFASVKTVEVDFSLMKHGIDVAYIAFADSTWERQWWHDGNDYTGVKATEAVITGAGDYTVALDFTGTEYGGANGLAFTALCIQNGEKNFPGYFLKINDIRIGGESVAFVKGYTTSDDGVTTRMNIFNEWVGNIPAEARSYDGVTEDANWIMIDKALFTEKTASIEVDFTVIPKTDTAYIMYADAAWANQYWGGEAPEGITAVNPVVDGAGTYVASLEFASPAADIAFAALGITTGEKTFPGYFVDITDIKVNGESIAFTKGYTSSDDGITTRENIFNEWVAELPADARRADNDLEGASPIIVDKAAFASVEKIEVTFDYIYGEPPAAEAVQLSEAELETYLTADYNAYIGVQSKNYIFRNAWNDTYGRDDETNVGFFNRLTGWDAENNPVDYAGAFVDAAITEDGTYTVSLTTGEMGFGSDESFNLLFVSTDIPSILVKNEHVTITDVKVKFGEAKTQEYTEIDAKGDYVRIVLLDSYNQSAEPFGYTVPGANTPIVITFTVNGLK